MKTLLISVVSTVAFIILAAWFALALDRWIVAFHEKYDPRYTVTIKNTDTVHRNARIRVTEGAVLCVTDAEGRKYIYREGWEAVEEAK